MSSHLDSLFDDTDKGSQRLFDMLRDPDVIQIEVNAHNRIFFTQASGQKTMVADQIFPGSEQYVRWLSKMCELTDAVYDPDNPESSIIEGSFLPSRSNVRGSVHIATTEVASSEPALTVRKQPETMITLDDMLRAQMMSGDMRLFLQQAVQGRLNILISAGSGVGKTTVARALSRYIDPANRVVTVEEIDELQLAERLPNVVALRTFRHRDALGRVVRETTLDDLVRESLRMRADRVWVGETRGSEAYALVKACNSGHDGSVTTIHADDAPQAVRQLVAYGMEYGMTEALARDQVSRAFHLVVHLSREKMGRRVVRHIYQLEPVVEGLEQRRIELYRFDPLSGGFAAVSRPSNYLIEALQRYGVNYDDPSRLSQYP